MSSELMKKISGQLTDVNNNPLSSLPFGISIEMTILSSPPVSAGGWIGSAPVKANGTYELFTAYDINSPEIVIYQLYKDDVPFKREAINVYDLIADPIVFTQDEYAQLSAPDLCGYASISGNVTLGDKVPAAPLDTSVTIEVHKLAFGSNPVIASSTIDTNGHYCIRLPLNMVGLADTGSGIQCCNAKPAKVFVTLTRTVGETRVIAERSENIDVTGDCLTLDIHTDKSEYYSLFKTEMDAVAANITRITNVAAGNFSSFTTDGDDSDLQSITGQSAMGSMLLENMVFAAKNAAVLGIPLNHSYALTRFNGQDRNQWLSISLDDLTALVSNAVTGHVIPAGGDVNATYSKISSGKADWLFNEKTENGDTVGTVLRAVVADTAVVKNFLMLNETLKEADTDTYWAAVTSAMPNQAVTLKKGMQILSLNGMQPEVTTALMQDLATSGQAVSSLALKDLAYWQDIVNRVSTAAGKICVPVNIQQNAKQNGTDAKTDYANIMYTLTTDAFATTVIADQLTKDTTFGGLFAGNAVAVKNFLTTNPQFDFRYSNIWDITSDKFAQIDAVKATLLPVQNLTRIAAGKPLAVTAMVKDGIKSSADIAALDKEVFLAKYAAALGGQAVASTIYAVSQQTASISANIMASNSPGVTTSNTGAIQAVNPGVFYTLYNTPTSSQTPSLQTLFGSMDMCNCSDCMSMYSPGAYYADILNFMQKKLVVGTGSNALPKPFNELTRRRPDLLHIDLSCKNANVAMPYVDLVNELLEMKIWEYFNSTSLNFRSYQTSSTTAELKAYPEHTIKATVTAPNTFAYQSDVHYQDVYDKVLKWNIFPDKNPLNLALEESRIYFSHLNNDRYSLLQQYKPRNYAATTGAPEISEYKACAEWLGLSKFAADIIIAGIDNASFLNVSDANKIGQASDPALRYYYGFNTDIYPGGATKWYNYLTNKKSGSVVANPANGLHTLLERTGMSYTDLLQVLVTDTFNPLANGTRAFAIVSTNTAAPDTCDLGQLELRYKDGSADDTPKTRFFDMLHRFLRLQKSTGWTTYQLDMVLKSLSVSIDYTAGTYANPLTATAFKQVANLHKLQQLLGIAPEKMISNWSTISTTAYLNITGNQETLPSVYDTLFNNKAVMNPPDSAFTDPNAPGFPTDYAGHTGTIVAAFGITAEELTRLFAFVNAASGNLTALSLGILSKVYGLTLLAKGLKISVDYLLRLCRLCGMNGAFSGSVQDRIDFLNNVIQHYISVSSLPFSLDELEYLFEHNDSFGYFIPQDETIRIFYEELRAELKKQQDSNLASSDIASTLGNIIIRKFATQFNIDGSSAKSILENILQVSPTQNLYQYLSGTVFITGQNDILQAAYTALYDAYRKADKTAMILSRLVLSTQETEACQDATFSAFAFPQFSQLPVSYNVNYDPAPYFAQFLNLAGWIKNRDTLNLRPEELISLWNSAMTSTFVSKLVGLTGWDSTMINFLIGTGASNNILGVTLSGPSDYARPELLAQLIQILKSAKEIGLTPQVIYDALKSGLQLAQSTLIRQAAKAKHDEAEWLTIAKPLQDVLREKQRRALVNYMVVRPEMGDTNTQSTLRWKDENGLFAYYLIDVEMQPCMLTSRLKQAISSVQLFVDRLIMNLENEGGNPSSHLLIAPDKIAQWEEWRKWYRIWEANRKIFLYPENWIEPELRDDKTPFFRELETQLMQDEVTDGKAEDAFRYYLEQLDEVARLEPVTAYHQKENGVDIKHVFARTNKQPYRYFYRRLQNKEWSPWEKVNADIKSDHVVPLVWNGRLQLFWFTFNKKKGNKWIDNTRAGNYVRKILQRKNESYSFLDITGGTLADPNQDNNNQNDLKFCWDLKLNWSQYKDGKWLATEICDDIVNLFMGNQLLNDKEMQSYAMTDAKMKNRLNQGSKGGAYDLAEFFRSRTQVSITTSTYLAKDGFTVDLLFFGGYNENATSIVTFAFPDGNAKPFVVREGDTGSQVLSPIGTYAKDMKFVRPTDKNDSDTGGGLAIESVRTNNDWYFSNAMNWWYTNSDQANPNPNRKLRFPHLGYDTKAPNYLLKNTDSAFRLTKFGSTDSNTFDSIIDRLFWQGYPGGNGIFYDAALNYNKIDSCINDYFFYEDDKNTFYVEKISQTANFNAVLTLGKSTLASASQSFSSLSYSGTSLPVSYSPPANANTFTLAYSGSSAAANALPASLSSLNSGQLVALPQSTYYFQTFYHAQVHNFQKQLDQGGVPQLLQLKNQNQGDSIFFGPLNAGKYQPTTSVNTNYPKSNVQFLFTDPYGIYNWELFFHAPMIIAQRLSDNQQFEEAQKWFHYIFNPTSTVDMDGVTPLADKKRFWKFYPFYKEASSDPQTLVDLLNQIAAGTTGADGALAQIAKWEANPFQPHVIARMRKLAYMKNVVMKYIDNLLAWGDQLFSRDTIESINEASQLYIMAANILGTRPEVMPARVKKNYYTYNELLTPSVSGSAGFDGFSNAMVNIESFFAPNAAVAQTGNTITTSSAPLGRTPYFCLPENDKLFAYWDTVADRLFKIRNCMDINGENRQLPLYEPPIDPALLVRAKALGIDISSILNNVSAVGSLTSNYRFSYMLQKANEFCGEVRGLGSSLLSALEKKDAEQLSLLRSGQEMKMLDRMTVIKENQVTEAQAALDGLNLTKENTQMRYTYYSTRPYMNPQEQQQMVSAQTGMVLQKHQAQLQTTASTLALIPQTHIAGIASGLAYGGQHIAGAMNAISSYVGISAVVNSAQGSMAATMGGYDRRNDDWVFQADTASKELEQLDQQILAAEIRLDIARKELTNHLVQVDNTADVDAFMRNKFTNAELYSWMSGQLASTYFRSYQMAYELAKRAEKCFTDELPAKGDTRNFITFGYWDSLRKGLMSGEKLQYDLRKMETAYMDENSRELELTKSFSLALTDPAQLVILRNTGTCVFDLSEIWYNLDFPSHYMRRIKSVSLSIPCVAGPYSTVGATLKLTSSKIQRQPQDTNYINVMPVTNAIATSSAQNDAGVFELSFRDERYVPFENAGAISSWRLDMMDSTELRQFDYSTISDVVIHVKYTARNDDDTSANGKGSTTKAALKTLLGGMSGNVTLQRYFSTPHEFSNEWYAGFNTTVALTSGETLGRPMDLKFSRSQFPEYAQDKKIDISKIHFFINPVKTGDVYYIYSAGNTPAPLILTGNSGDLSVNLSMNNGTDSVNFSFVLYKKVGTDQTITKVEESELADLYLVADYKLIAS